LKTYVRAAEAAREAADAELLARAALGYANHGGFGFRNPTSVTLLEDALAALGVGDSPLCASCLGLLGEVLVLGGLPPAGSLELTAGAVAIGQRLNDPATLAFALHERFWAIIHPDHMAEREAVVAELGRLAVAVGDVDLPCSTIPPRPGLNSYHHCCRCPFSHRACFTAMGLGGSTWTKLNVNVFSPAR